MVANYLNLIRPLFSFDNTKSGNDLYLVYKDEISAEKLDQILAITEYQINAVTEERSIKKKLFNVLVEAAQNILKHGESKAGIASVYKSMLVIGRESPNFFIISGNVIRKSKIDTILKKLDEINSLDEFQLKQMYNKAIQENEFSDKGGAGLGLIDIARKTGNKIEYCFTELDKDYSYITLKSVISPKN